MDIQMLQASAYELPTSRRVGVVVHDGASDTRLWPGPGPDRELLAAYGPDLSTALEREREKIGDALPIGSVLRLHPGRLHCDFMVWIATREPEQAGRQAPAPSREMLETAVRAALEFASERNVIRIAFPALGEGPEALDPAERLAIIARAANAWHEERFASGRPSQIEEVLICDKRLSKVTEARKLANAIVKAPAAETRSSFSSDRPPPPKKKASTRKAGSRGAAAARKPKLDDGELAYARTTARPWDRTVKYSAGDWFVHAKFGVGRVSELSPDGYIVVLFEDGETRKLVHMRPPA